MPWPRASGTQPDAHHGLLRVLQVGMSTEKPQMPPSDSQTKTVPFVAERIQRAHAFLGRRLREAAALAELVPEAAAT